MKKIALISITIVWISAVIILIASMMHFFPDSVIEGNQFLVSIAFIAITAILKLLFNSIIHKKAT